MSGLEVLQNRWLILALLGGAGLVLGMALAYLALWRPRTAEGDRPVSEGGHESPEAPVPWFLVLTFAGVAAYAVIYVIVQAINPPNW
jgi:hypothetical protein